VLCRACKRENLTNAGRCATCGIALEQACPGEFPSGTSCAVGPSFFGRPDSPVDLPRRLRRRRAKPGRTPLWLTMALTLALTALGRLYWDLRVSSSESGSLMRIEGSLKGFWEAKEQGASPKNLGTTAANNIPRIAPLDLTRHFKSARSDVIVEQDIDIATRQSKKLPMRQKSGLDEHEGVRGSHVSISSRAAALLTRATAKGDPDAPVSLANMYLKGDGVPHSCEEAMALLESAANKPNLRARKRLAALYATGGCVQRDRLQAYGWLASALRLDPHDPWARQNRDLILRQMTPEERATLGSYR
jgi:Sel1 repeat-containing protein